MATSLSCEEEGEARVCCLRLCCRRRCWHWSGERLIRGKRLPACLEIPCAHTQRFGGAVEADTCATVPHHLLQEPV